MKYVKSKSKSRSTTKRRVSKKKTGLSLAVKSYVKSAIHRTAETKIASTTQAINTYNSGITSSSDFLKLLPIITQGVAQNSRVGSEIKPIKLVVRGYLVYNSYSNANATMLGPRMFLMQQKQIRSYANGITNFDLLDLGGDGTNFTGAALDFVSPHNKDAFYFYADKKTKMLKPYGYTNNISSSTSMSDIPSNLFYPFTITIRPGSNGFPATLKYDNASGSNQYPTNFAPYLAMGYCNLLNFSPDVIDAQVSMEFISTLYYEDV